MGVSPRQEEATEGCAEQELAEGLAAAATRPPTVEGLAAAATSSEKSLSNDEGTTSSVSIAYDAP